MKFTLHHADTCLPDYWGGHHLPHIQISVHPNMTTQEVKSALLSEVSQGAIAGSIGYQVTESELFHYLAKQAIEQFETTTDVHFTDVEEPQEDDDCIVYAFFVFDWE